MPRIGVRRRDFHLQDQMASATSDIDEPAIITCQATANRRDRVPWSVAEMSRVLMRVAVRLQAAKEQPQGGHVRQPWGQPRTAGKRDPGPGTLSHVLRPHRPSSRVDFIRYFGWRRWTMATFQRQRAPGTAVLSLSLSVSLYKWVTTRATYTILFTLTRIRN